MEKIKKCEVCGKNFSVRNMKKKWCSQECSNIHWKEYHVKYNKTLKERRDRGELKPIKERNEYIKKKMKEYHQRRKDTPEYKSRILKKTSSEDWKKKRTEYIKKKKNMDPLFRLKCNIRSNISVSMKKVGFKKESKISEILGCTYAEFKIWIESKFLDGMSWENYGKWEYDHIIPISNGKNIDEIIKLNHYTNFQPLWKYDNIRKGNKIL